MAFDSSSGKLYVADENAPVIHILNASSPCNMVEQSPLLPMSASRPDRPVFSRSIAVSPPTTQGNKYLYATDLYDGSVMVFDVSLQAADRTPLLRPHAWRSPFQPLDRIAFSVPVKDIEFVLRDSPATDPANGSTAVGISCDPSDPAAPGARYRTSSDFSSGARPYNLRGVFAALALTNGEIAIIDVDDFDQPCRRPTESGACAGDTSDNYDGASSELSCDMVQPHAPRSAYFISLADDAGGRVPGLQAYPSLALKTSVLPVDQTVEGRQTPKLLAPITPDARLTVGGREVAELQTDPSTSDKSMVVFDLRAPRVHTAQAWSVGFEASLPGFDGHMGRLDAVADDQGLANFYDAGAFFCDRGVYDTDTAATVAADLDVGDAAAVATWAQEHRDVLQVTSDFLDDKDPYWGSVAGQCSWVQCRETFGVVLDPKSTRDLPIVEARQGSLRVDAGGMFGFMRCCFPSLVSYTVRGKNQWIVTGSAAGFLHRVVPDPATGRCIDSCDPHKTLLRGRAFERDQSATVPAFDGAGVFRNPAVQFVVWRGAAESERGMTFSFRQSEGFTPLMINLASATRYVQPRSLVVAPTGELALPDGSWQGLILVNLGSLAVSRSFY